MFITRPSPVATILATLLFFVLPSCHPAATIDLPAGDLDVRISVLEDGVPPNGKNLVTMQFLQAGKSVQLLSNVGVSCNGVLLPFNALFQAYMERVAIVPVGGTYTFVHTRAGVPTTVQLSAPPRPVIVAPPAGGTATRSNNFTIGYVQGTGSGVRGSVSDATSAIGGSPGTQPDNGSYSGINATTLQPGPGKVSVTREFTGTPAGTGFHSTQTTYDTISDETVTWN